MFAHKKVEVSIYVLLQIFYCPTAVFISHFAYRHFKAMSHEMMGGGMNFMAQNPNQAEQADQPYHRAPEEAPNQGRNNGGYFQGQGVAIG